jgi:hypothetical protein
MSTWIKTRGTQTGEFGLGFDGPLLKNDSGNLNVRNSSNASFANVHAASFNTTGNVVAGNVLTDNYLYANGAPVDFQQAAGSNGEIQFNLNNDFGASPNLSWNGTTNTLSATNFSGNGYTLTAINAANIVGNISGNISNANYAAFAGNVVDAAQPNITSVGNLTGLNVSGNALITGNLVVDGNLVYVNVENLYVEDPIIELGGGANGAPLTTNDGKDRGAILNYYTAAPVEAFMGYDNSNAEMLLASNVSVTNEVVTVNAFGNVRVGNVIGNLFGVANSAVTANTVTDAAQANITSVGTLTVLNVNGTSNLGPVGNVVITGGSNGHVLTTDGTGNLSFQATQSIGDTWKADSTTVNYNSGATIAAMTLPVNAIVDKVSVIVDTVFTGTAPTLTVGLQGGSGFEYVAANDANLKVGDRYDVPSQIAPVGSSGNIEILYTADGSGAGAARVIVTYTVPV